MGIRFKILSIAMIIVVAGITAEVITSSYIFTREYSKALNSRAYALGESLRAQLDRIFSLGISLDELVGFDKQCEELVKRNKDIDYARVLDPNGNVLFSSDSSRRTKARNLSPSGGMQNPEGLGATAAHSHGDYEAVIPIPNSRNENMGELVIGIKSSVIDEKIGRLVKYSVIVTVVTLSLAITLLLLSLRRWVTEPLTGLLEAIRLLDRDEKGFYNKIKVASKDEIGLVSSAFNGLIEDLNASHEIISLQTEKLEATVKERTAELWEVNARLQRDIAERKKVEDALRESDAFIKAVMDNLPVGVAVNTVQPTVEFIYMNDNFPGYYRTTREKLAHPDAFWEAVYEEPEFREEMRARVMADCGSGDPERMHWVDVPIIREGEHPHFITARNVLVPDKQLMISIVWDVTEQKAAQEERRILEERLQRAEKMEALGTLAGGVAHDLNNVLGIVVGYAELLLDDMDGSSAGRDEAMEILKGGQKAAAIVQDLLTLARRGVQGRKTLNLNNIILDCQKSPAFKNVLSYNPDIRVVTDLDADLLNISGSAIHLEKSFLNLISNAAEAMPGGGSVTIRTRNQYLDKPVSGYDEVKEGDYVVLSVSDTGEGIPAADLMRIFEPFYTKKVMGRSGTGLGLAVVWGTVKDHYGYINVESEEGRGTVFSIYFPVSREEISLDQVSVSAAQYMGNGESILIVDDSKEQRELAAKMLTKLNYRVATASGGEAAVEYLTQNEADLVVLDMIMDPGIDGLDTYKKILDIHPHQRAIIVSGFSETARVAEAQALGAGAYMRKPYVLSSLGMTVRKELDQTERGKP